MCVCVCVCLGVHVKTNVLDMEQNTLDIVSSYCKYKHIYIYI